MTLRLAILWALSLVVGAGCSTSSSSPYSGIGGDAGDSVFGRREDNELLHLAEQTLISRCMQERGFEYQVAPLPEDSFEAHPYGNDDVDRSRANGYGLGERTRGQSSTGDLDNSTDPNSQYVDSLPEPRRQAFTIALFGPPSGRQGHVGLPGGLEIGFPLEGCLADARQELYKDGEEFMSAVSIIDNLGTEVQTRVVAEKSYVKAREQWHDCMHQRGYDAERPADAVRLAISAYATGDAAEARLREIEIAVADAECAQRTALVKKAEQLESEIWHDVLNDNTGAIESYRELRGLALERARGVLEDA